MEIRKATRQRKKLRVAVDGPSGAGKTYTLIRLATAMLRRGLCAKILVIDTENESSALYVGENPDGTPFAFDVICLKTFAPAEYVAALQMAARAGYDCLVVDSLSHAWVGEGGALDQIDRKSTDNKFTAWKDVTPQHRRMIDAIIQSPAHILASMRSKTEYVLEEDHRGKKVPRKIGVAPVQRDGMEYEFDLYASIDWEHVLRVSKSRCSAMQDAIAPKPGPGFWAPLFDWMDGAAAETVAAAVVRDARTPDERERDQFAEDIDRAATEAALQAVGRAIGARGFADAAVKTALKERYKKRLDELAAARAAPVPAAPAAPAAEPPEPGSFEPDDTDDEPNPFTPAAK